MIAHNAVCDVMIEIVEDVCMNCFLSHRAINQSLSFLPFSKEMHDIFLLRSRRSCLCDAYSVIIFGNLRNQRKCVISFKYYCFTYLYDDVIVFYRYGYQSR